MDKDSRITALKDVPPVLATSKQSSTAQVTGPQVNTAPSTALQKARSSNQLHETLKNSSDLQFLFDSADLSDDKFSELLQNLKNTLISFKENTQEVTKGLTNSAIQKSMLVKRK